MLHLVPKVLLFCTLVALNISASSGAADVTNAPEKNKLSSFDDAGDDAAFEIVSLKSYFQNPNEATIRKDSDLSVFSDGGLLSGGELIPGAPEDDLVAALSNIALSSADGIDNAPKTLKKLSAAMSLLQNHVYDPNFIESIPLELRSSLSSFVNQLSAAKNHIEKVEDIISDYYEVLPASSSDVHSLPRPISEETSIAEGATTTSTHRSLSGNQGDTSTATNYYDSGASGADYLIRAQSHMHQGGGLGIGEGFLGQQGHFGARMQRQEGGIRRRLATNGGKECVDVTMNERKEEQCYRLANCARNYNFYDLFVFFFGDDIDFVTGEIDSKIVAKDEANLKVKVSVANPFFHLCN